MPVLSLVLQSGCVLADAPDARLTCGYNAGRQGRAECPGCAEGPAGVKNHYQSCAKPSSHHAPAPDDTGAAAVVGVRLQAQQCQQPA